MSKKKKTTEAQRHGGRRDSSRINRALAEEKANQLMNDGVWTALMIETREKATTTWGSVKPNIRHPDWQI